jgi:hypothetical protein
MTLIPGKLYRAFNNEYIKSNGILVPWDSPAIIYFGKDGEVLDWHRFYPAEHKQIPREDVFMIVKVYPFHYMVLYKGRIGYVSATCRFELAL